VGVLRFRGLFVALAFPLQRVWFVLALGLDLFAALNGAGNEYRFAVLVTDVFTCASSLLVCE
jgi:hypothetical protein